MEDQNSKNKIKLKVGDPLKRNNLEFVEFYAIPVNVEYKKFQTQSLKPSNFLNFENF